LPVALVNNLHVSDCNRVKAACYTLRECTDCVALASFLPRDSLQILSCGDGPFSNLENELLMDHHVIIGFKFTRWSAPACTIIFFLFPRHHPSVVNAALRALRLKREEASPVTTKPRLILQVRISGSICRLRQLALPSSLKSTQGTLSVFPPSVSTP